MRLRRHSLPHPLVALSAALICTAAVACAGEAEGTGGGGARARNLILISVDTLRADHLGCYGYQRGTSPEIDRWAAAGTVFADATAAGPWTVPSHMSMLTGVYTRTHGMDGWEQSLPEDVETLASHLQARGFATAGIVNVSLLSQKRSFDRGFQNFTVVPEAKEPRGATKTILSGAIPWLREHRQGPFFLFLHFYDVHSDFNPLPKFRKQFERMYNGGVDGSTLQLRWYRKTAPDPPWTAVDARHLIDLYDAGIRQFDEHIAELFDVLRNELFLEDTLVLLTSDHGEEFLEHGDILHGRTLHQELVRVPLIAVGPGVPAGKVVAGSASHVDLMPTALSLLGLPLPAAVEGVDLSTGWDDSPRWDPERPVFAEADKWLKQEAGNYRRMIRRGKYTLHYDRLSGAKAVYDIEADPFELNDLSASQPALVAALWAELESFMSTERQVESSIELSPEDMQELEDLGYF